METVDSVVQGVNLSSLSKFYEDALFIYENRFDYELLSDEYGKRYSYVGGLPKDVPFEEIKNFLFQFGIITHKSNIPGSYAQLFFNNSDFQKFILFMKLQ